jgi:putative transposase
MKLTQQEIKVERQRNQEMFLQTIKQEIKATLEKMLESELTNLIQENREKQQIVQRNGSYHRNLLTPLTNIEQIKVPRDRKNEYEPLLFDPYKRHSKEIDQLVLSLYSYGVSTRDITNVFNKLYGIRYSAQTVSNITRITLDEVNKWHKRSLKRRYYVVYLDSMVIKIRRRSVDNEAVYFIIGVNEDGLREVIDFWVGGQESAEAWKDHLRSLKKRGLEEVLLFVMDGLSGLEEAVSSVYPKAEQQLCILHQIRNTMKRVTVKDRYDLVNDLKPVYHAYNETNAHAAWQEFKSRWGKIYPKIISSWEDNWYRLFTYFNYPEAIRKVIYTTNWIERSNKEFRKRAYAINSFSNENAVEKLVYLKAIERNETWSRKKLYGFCMVSDQLDKMIETKYGSKK